MGGWHINVSCFRLLLLFFNHFTLFIKVNEKKHTVFMYVFSNNILTNSILVITDCISHNILILLLIVTAILGAVCNAVTYGWILNLKLVNASKG